MLDSNQIFIRKMRPSDASYILNWENNPANWLSGQTTAAFSKQEIESFVNEPQQIEHRNQLRLIICLADETPIGCIDLFEYDKQKKQAGVGVLIADKTNRNRGFATLALNQLKTYARNELQIVHLFCNIQPDNQASLRLFEKCGFRFVEEQDLNGETVHYFQCEC